MNNLCHHHRGPVYAELDLNHNGRKAKERNGMEKRKKNKQVLKLGFALILVAFF